MNNTGIHANNAEAFDKIDFTRPIRYGHKEENKDSSVCVIQNGKIIYANAEERFVLRKHEGGSSRNTMIDIKQHLDEKLLEELDAWQKIPYVSFVDHHITHIYEVFYNSGFDEAAVFVNDGCGTSNDCITLAYMKRGEEPLILKKFSDEYSLGILYSVFSANTFQNPHDGSKRLHTDNPNFNEGKFMGLASYGTPIPGLTLIKFENGELVWNMDVLQEIGLKFSAHELLNIDKKYSFKDYPMVLQANYAATMQRDFENCSLDVIRYFHQLLKENGIETKNLCMSGGCILNCPTNSKIIDLGLFENYYASPNPTDGGVGFGLLYRRLISEDKQNAFQYKRLDSPYLGYNYTYQETLKDLKQTEWYESYKNWFTELGEVSLNVLCDYLANQKILCWYQGGAEFGPRALGHRSLLADPRTFVMNQKLNKIKGRELWRPLAPVVPEELFKDVFEVDNTDLCEFMLRTLKIKEKWVPMLKAVCHVDGTARPQLLKKSLNPELYNLLMVWYKKTGCPALINTSLNLAGFPIVERSSQVLDLMHTSGSPELIGVFVGGTFDMTVVPNII